MFRVIIIFSNSQEHLKSIEMKFVLQLMRVNSLSFSWSTWMWQYYFFMASSFRSESLSSCTGKGSWFCRTC